MALLKITHFWSNLLEGGYQHNFPIWGYQDIFSNLGVPGHFSNMIEQFVRMGVPAQFSNLGVPAHFSNMIDRFFSMGGTSTIFSTLHGSLWFGKDKGSIMKSVESGGTIHLEINFSSKVYSKSLLNVGLLKGSIAYSLISDYQFCTMRNMD